MASDDPISQALSEIDAYSGRRGEVLGFLREHGLAFIARCTEVAAAIASGSPVGLLGQAAGILSGLHEARTVEDLQYLLSVVAPEVQRLTARFDSLEEAHRRFLKEEWPALFMSAHRKADEDPFQRKRERIGEIIKNAAIRCPKDADADAVEELLRIAIALSDLDVIVLREIFEAQRKNLGPEGRVSRPTAFSGWPIGRFHALGLKDSVVESSCAKLYGFGLVRPCEDLRLNNLSEAPIAYGFLAKGVRFIEFAALGGETQKATA